MDTSVALTVEQASNISASDFTALLESWIKYSITEEEEALQVSTLLYSLFSADRGDLLEMFIERMEKEYNVADYSYLCKIITFSLHADVMLFLSSVVSMEFYHLMYGLAVIKDDTLIAHALANINVLFPNAEGLCLQR